MFNRIDELVKKESSPGIILMIATFLALVLQNDSTTTDFYTNFLNTPVQLSFGDVGLKKPLLLWINDGLMALFFFLVGLEIKQEVLEGELSSREQLVLPLIAALGGMFMPAVVFTFFNYGDSFAMQGWAIPAATDIAFALGILSLLGSRVPVSLKIFLMALAIIDDLGAIVIIALFYTGSMSITSMLVALCALAVLIAMNYFGVYKKGAYIMVGVVLWLSVLQSGVHATIAGVILAFTVPLYSIGSTGDRFSILKEMAHDLHHWVAFLILPLFAFANAGVDLKGINLSSLFNNVSIGIIFALFFGKQAGVFSFSYIAIKLGFAKMPTGSTFKQLYGVSILTGIGFTMSLFVDTLAYSDSDLFHHADKLSILIGSFLSGTVGYFFLKRITKPAIRE